MAEFDADDLRPFTAGGLSRPSTSVGGGEQAESPPPIRGQSRPMTTMNARPESRNIIFGLCF